MTMFFKWAMLIDDIVIDIKESENMPKYPPTPDGKEVMAVEVNYDENVGLGYTYENGKFYPPKFIPAKEPEPTIEEMLLEIQVNTEYLVCLNEINEE